MSEKKEIVIRISTEDIPYLQKFPNFEHVWQYHIIGKELNLYELGRVDTEKVKFTFRVHSGIYPGRGIAQALENSHDLGHILECMEQK